uniref:Uncharacterized protein n=1 Tax=Parascaris equorum TaxID=6256 RepID=A0A914R800_PAREQ
MLAEKLVKYYADLLTEFVEVKLEESVPFPFSS